MLYSLPPGTLTRQGAQLQAADLARRIVDLLADRQAEDILLLDISGVASFADFFVIASAGNPRHMNALIDTLDRDLGKDGVSPLRREGAPDSGWVLLDFSDVVVHLFAPEQRSYYNLEHLWSRGVEVVRIQ